MATNDTTEVVLMALEGCVSQGAEAKVEALKGLTALIDPSDESYSVQREAAERLLPATLMRLLDDDDPSVQREAASCLAALADHSGAVTEKIGAGHFVATAEKAPLNPVQELVGDADGIFNALVNMKFSSDDEALSAAASDALAALTSLNRANTLSLVHEFVKRLAAGEARALRALDDLVEGGLVEARDDAAKVLLDQALAPALGFLRRGGAPASERVAAAALLGSIAEGRGGAASFLVAEGALPDAAALLADGPDVEARDAAARLVWALVKDQRALLAPGRDKGLGVDGTKLVEPLLELIELSEAQEADQKDADGEGEEAAAAAATAVDNGDEALLLLRALAAQDEDVSKRLKGDDGLIRSRSCVVM